MIELEKIALKNIVTHKNSSLEIQPGFTTIRGDNGAGKSLLFNCIPNVFDGAVPLAKKKDAKAIHTADESAIGVKYKYNGKEYRVVQKNKKGSLSYDIEEDGTQLQPRTLAMAKEMLEKVFPISPAQYYTLVHLTTYRPHVLLSGTGPQRKEFFEELFHLNVSDFILEKAKEKLNELKRLKDEAEILKTQLQETTFIDNISDLEEKYSKATDKYNELNKKYLEFNTNIQKLTSIETYKNQLNTQLSFSQLEEKISDFKEKISKLEERIRKFLVDKDLFEKNQTVINRKIDLENQLNNFSDLTGNSDEVKELYQTDKLKLQSLQEELNKAEENNEKFQTFNNLDKLIDKKYREMTFEKYLGYIGKVESEMEEKENIINRLEKLDGEKICPMCQQVLNEDTIKSLIGSLNNDILYLGMEVQVKQKTIEWYKLKQLNLQEIDSKGLSEEIESTKETLRSLKSKYEKLKEKESIELQLKSLPEVLNIEKPDDTVLNNYKEKLEAGKEKLKILESDLKIQNELKKLYSEGLDELNLDELNSSVNELSPKIEKLNSIRMELNSKIQIGKSQNSIYIKKKDRIEEIGQLLEDLPLYDALTKAYGAKGIRVDQIKFLAEAFCENLNKFSSLVFNKKVKFSVNVDSTNFNIYADRNGGLIADVNTFSGAESRCFCLLCLLSLLPFVPEKYRTDFVILDEMEAGIQEAGRKLLTQGFFKALNNIVPKIIVITPMSPQEYYIESNKEYYLRLKNNTTEIQEIK